MRPKPRHHHRTADFRMDEMMALARNVTFKLHVFKGYYVRLKRTVEHDAPSSSFSRKSRRKRNRLCAYLLIGRDAC